MGSGAVGPVLDTAGEEQPQEMIRTALIAWVGVSVPCSVLLGKMCRVASVPLPMSGREPVLPADALAHVAR